MSAGSQVLPKVLPKVPPKVLPKPEMPLPKGTKLKNGMTGKKLTTYAIGGPVPLFIEIEEEEALASLVKLMAVRGDPFKVIGAGSNLLIPDEGIDHWVIKLGRSFRFWSQVGSQVGKEEFVVGGAMPLITLSHELSSLGFSGLEFAGGIPASIGGATYMNAGAHGSSMSEIIKEVSVVTDKGEIIRLSNKEIDFSYRKSNLPSNSIVTKIWIKLTPGDKDLILKQRAENLVHRKAAQPITVPSAGSVFKNPPGGLTAGVLIEQAGLKGFTIGGAKVSEKHGNWIVNQSREATAADVVSIIEVCQDSVKEKSGVELKPEVLIW